MDNKRMLKILTKATIFPIKTCLIKNIFIEILQLNNYTITITSQYTEDD